VAAARDARGGGRGARRSRRWPRRATLAEVAAALGADEAALDAQLHNREQLVLAALLEDGTLGDVVEPAHPLSDATSTDGG
jgi:hypothetical protein